MPALVSRIRFERKRLFIRDIMSSAVVSGCDILTDADYSLYGAFRPFWFSVSLYGNLYGDQRSTPSTSVLQHTDITTKGREALSVYQCVQFKHTHRCENSLLSVCACFPSGGGTPEARGVVGAKANGLCCGPRPRAALPNIFIYLHLHDGYCWL